MTIAATLDTGFATIELESREDGGANLSITQKHRGFDKSAIVVLTEEELKSLGSMVEMMVGR